MEHSTGFATKPARSCYSRVAVIGAVLAVMALIEVFMRYENQQHIVGSSTVPFIAEKSENLKQTDDVVMRWLNELSLKEKCDLLRGSVETHGYTGFVPGNSRLGIPSLRMNDGPQGFRGPKRTSTAWPCGLSMAATFYPELVHKVAKANGKEFLGKGSNVLLGPGMNLARIARNGRNFEYLCGEDPLLGEVMAAAYIQGAQSNPGLIATAKHFVNNEQETDRTKVSAIIDEETEWNMYYRPFRASVIAGVGSIMCSYNRVNGFQGCANANTIKRDLQGRMGYKFFVMSDWFAVTATVETAMAGTDVEMPIPLYYGEALQKAVEAGKVPVEIVNDKVKRVLTTIVEYNMTEIAKPDIQVNVSTAAHSILAREAAAHSVVLLKNDGDILPISSTGSLNILVIGDRAHDHVISTGGGSGHVHPPYVVTPLQGLQYGGSNHKFTYANTVQAMGFPDAVYATADLVVACVGTSSTEGLDRPSLSLDPNEIGMVKQATLYSKKVVVSIISPGAVLMPFADDVRAIMLQFMPGQEVGNALADVIYGKVDPGGARLPLTIPRRENERNMTKKQYPGQNYEEEYTERSEIGYRWYSTHPNVKPRYFFGHGMSYANIHFLGATFHQERNGGDLVFRLGLVNLSKRKGALTPQVYITEYPAAVRKFHAPLALIGFTRVEFGPFDIKVATIRVEMQSMKIWTKEKQEYFLFKGTYEIGIGTSANDFWKKVKFTV